ncbi:B2L13 protein, partial [Polypterus senegalus]
MFSLISSGVQIEKEIATKVKADVEEELKLLEEEISKAFTSTGFDCHTSPVFNPANPESSIEDCLAHLGGKVLVPLVLLQELLKELTRQGEQPLNVLLQYGVQYVEDSAADFIIQQGGWLNNTIASLQCEEGVAGARHVTVRACSAVQEVVDSLQSLYLENHHGPEEDGQEDVLPPWEDLAQQLAHVNERVCEVAESALECEEALRTRISSSQEEMKEYVNEQLKLLGQEIVLCLQRRDRRWRESLQEEVRKNLQTYRQSPIHSTPRGSQGAIYGTVFSLEEDEDQGAIAEDSNDIYILTSDNSGQVSPPESLTVTTSWQSESLPVSLSASQSWHTETLPVSLGPESWAQVGMDPEDVKSLDSGGAEERSENNSSNSDIVHVDKEEIAEEESAVSVAEVLEVHEAILKSEVETQELSSLELVKEAILSQAEVVPAVPAIVEESASEILLPPSTQEIPVIEKLAEKPPVKTEEPPKPAAVVRPVSEPDKPVLKPKTEEPLVEKAPDVVLTQTEKILKTSLKESGKETPIPPEDPVKIIESPVGEKPAQAPKDMTILYGGAAIAALAVAVVVMLVLRKK